MKNNMDLRTIIEKNRFRYYEVANKVGVSDATFSRWLRTPLNEERKERVLKAIEELTE